MLTQRLRELIANLALRVDTEVIDEILEELEVLEKALKPSENKFVEESKVVIDFLNKLTGSKYSFRESNLKFVRARLNEGFTVDDMKMVISKKTNDWIADEKMRQYLRPETLFNSTKFETYLSEASRQKGSIRQGTNSGAKII